MDVQTNLDELAGPVILHVMKKIENYTCVRFQNIGTAPRNHDVTSRYVIITLSKYRWVKLELHVHAKDSTCKNKPTANAMQILLHLHVVIGRWPEVNALTISRNKTELIYITNQAWLCWRCQVRIGPISRLDPRPCNNSYWICVSFV